MNTSIKTELANHIIDKINDGIINDTNKEDWHFYCFNEDYYIIYHSKAIKWLKNHDLDTFEAIEIVKDYETNNFGKFTTNINPESIVNMIAYIYGEELLNEIDVNSIEELENKLNEIINA